MIRGKRRGKRLELRYEYWDEQLSRALKSWDSDLCPSEFHGAVTGLICANHVVAPDKSADVISALVGCPVGGHSIIIDELVDQLFDAFQATSFDVQPLISDENPTDRLAGLADWSHGFLLGLGWGPHRAGQSADTQQALEDLVQISRVALDDEINESDLEEVIEYVRMSAHMIFIDSRKT